MYKHFVRIEISYVCIKILKKSWVKSKWKKKNNNNFNFTEKKKRIYAKPDKWKQISRD